MRVTTVLARGLAAILLAAGTLLAEQPAIIPVPATPAAVPPLPPTPRTRTNSVVYPPVVGAVQAAAAAAPRPVVGNMDAFKFDAKEKTVNVKSGETEAKFAFAVTNVSKEDAIIMSVHTSCGCTAAKLPAQPWILKPGEGGEIGVTMNLAGKFGIVTKTVSVVTTAGTIPLLVKSVMPADAYQALQRVSERSRNMQIAAADRQAVFRGDCAKCHVEAGVGKKGHDLYAASCGVCHDAEHRATMVPVLRGRPTTFAADYWNNWIRNGKDGSLMPAFDAKRGGPLTEEQIASLVEYLAGDFTKEPVPAHLVVPVPAKPAVLPPLVPVPAAPAPAATKQ